MNMKHVSIKSLISKTETKISNFHTGIYLELGIFRGVLNSQNSRSSQFPGYCLLRGTERKIRRWLQLKLQIRESRNVWDTGQKILLKRPFQNTFSSLDKLLLQWWVQIREHKWGNFFLFASNLRNFTNEGMSEFPLLGQKSCENRPIF